MSAGDVHWLYKSPELADELAQTPLLMQELLRDFAELSCAMGIIPVVTRVLAHVEGSSGVHEAHRGVDCRCEYPAGVMLYTPSQQAEIADKLNGGRWARRDGHPSLLWHSFCGGPRHAHLQVAAEPFVYTNYPINKGDSDG